MSKNTEYKILDNLIQLRLNNDLNKSDVAAMVDISETLYTRYENGVTDIPLTTLKKLAKNLNSTTDYILGITNVNIVDYAKFHQLCNYAIRNGLDEKQFSKALKKISSLMSNDNTVLTSKSEYKQKLKMRFVAFGQDYEKLSQRTGLDEVELKRYLMGTQKETSIQMDKLTVIVRAMNDSLNSLFIGNERTFDKWHAKNIVTKRKKATTENRHKCDSMIDFVKNTDFSYTPEKAAEISSTENKTLNKRLSALRKQYAKNSGMTQDELAELCKCSLKTIQNYESSTYTDRSSMETLTLIADVFDTSIEYLDNPVTPISIKNFKRLSEKYLLLSPELQSEIDAFSEFLTERKDDIISMEEIKSQFSNNLKKAIQIAKDKKYVTDDDDLIKKANITKKTLDKYINGITCPNLKTAKRLCEVLKVDLDYLFINSNTKIENDELYRKLKRNFSCDYTNKLKYIDVYMNFLLSTQDNNKNT